MLRLTFAGAQTLPNGLAAMFAGGASPDVVAELDGIAVGRAAPMLEDRVWLGRMADTILSATITLIVSIVRAHFEKRSAPIAVSPVRTSSSGLLRDYLPRLAGGLAHRAWQRISRQEPAPWRTAYRFIDGPGVAETGALEGSPFTVLPDDGKRFYADPFVIDHDGRPVLFVEEFPYASRKGVISVAELGTDGRLGTPRVVLEEPHHLSYPQVFRHEGTILMIPESSGARELVLYRCERFPDVWRRDTVLLENTDINDATLLARADRHWLIGTARVGRGSSSDTMVVYGAPKLRGPWTPHRLNPIRIDRSASRPGGRFIDLGNGRLALPVQDGSLTYGGALGLMELIKIDDDDVVWGPVQPIVPGPAWQGRNIHTLNRVGSLEVVDSVR